MRTLNILSNLDTSHSLEEQYTGCLKSIATDVNKAQRTRVPSPHCLQRKGKGFAEVVQATLGPVHLV